MVNPAELLPYTGLFSAGQFATTFPRLAEVLPGSPANPHSSPENPAFDSNIQGAVTAVSAERENLLEKP